MKILNSKSKNFDKLLENLLLQRKKKIQSDSVSVTNIIKDVKKNGDKALLKYEKRFNQNNIIIPSAKQIKKSLNSTFPPIASLQATSTLLGYSNCFRIILFDFLSLIFSRNLLT